MYDGAIFKFKEIGRVANLTAEIAPAPVCVRESDNNYRAAMNRA